MLARTPFDFEASLRGNLGDLLPITSAQVRLLKLHFNLLVGWNERLNLTAIRASEEIVVRHYCECLFFAARCPAASGARIADLGSGGGFPGIPMAVLQPDWRVTLVESNQRKAVFLRESSRELHNISVLAQRAETVDEQFDWVVSRAVRPKEVLTHVPKLAQAVGLLVGCDHLRDLGPTWNVTRLPWGDRRCVAFNVSRET